MVRTTVQDRLEKYTRDPKIAYFSMEIGIKQEMPTYSGGLGVLAGDTIKSAADLRLPMVGVTLISRGGYFRQLLDERGWQTEEPERWDVSRCMELLPGKITVQIEGRDVSVQAWLYEVRSLTGGTIPVFFLDTGLPDNTPEDREITAQLYGGDKSYRLKQEIVLGIGGVRMLNRLGFMIRKYHMNEGHASLLALELLKEYRRDIEEVWDERLVWDVEKVRDLCVFTTHTPVEAGHDKFAYDLVTRVLGEPLPLQVLQDLAGKDHMNMTLLALNLSEYVNGVAKKHREVSQHMFPGYEINSVTNGVHSFTWTCESFRRLYDKYLPGWANEPELFVRVGRIPDDEIWAAHGEAKKVLVDFVRLETGVEMSPEIFTLGFARRATAYKRADLLFTDIERLERIGRGKLQLIYAGKAHPRDDAGKRLIEKIFVIKEKLKDSIPVAYLPNYNMDMALKLVSGVDVWLNTPMRPLEASGTSGMKATHNGVPNFSVLDGWWIEGHIENFTGWSIGPYPSENHASESSADNAQDAEDLYRKLEHVVMPTFYGDRNAWIRIMQNAIGKNAYYFNSHRMMRRYVTDAYIR
ncbi:MAG TPA: alpha-glucan family phosphorylase [Thermodesulfovibrionales bacterium]|nr:alpha-glucan family phosphorylase [Thermodesulfovibrionales bacterium]